MVILLLALLVLGPDKLPEYARKAGRYMNEFRRMTSGFQEEFRSAMDLSGVAAPSAEETPASEPATATGGDAIDRTTEGPRLLPRAETMSPPPPPAPAPAAEPVAPAPSGSEPLTDGVHRRRDTGPGHRAGAHHPRAAPGRPRGRRVARVSSSCALVMRRFAATTW